MTYFFKLKIKQTDPESVFKFNCKCLKSNKAFIKGGGKNENSVNLGKLFADGYT